MHPAVKLMKDEMNNQKMSLKTLQRLSGISYERLKNIMAARSAMTLKERDKISDALGVSPVNFFVNRPDLHNEDNDLFLDISWMPPDLRAAAIRYNKQLREVFEKRT
ncbi:helix-turn-helix domain-containing protein [Cedecea sp. S5-13]|uniref:helix-turn-helix domain-containing protein n=1 Tax=Cedecea selenatireducens TaxID=3144416 RepID=UPI0035CD37F1